MQTLDDLSAELAALLIPETTEATKNPIFASNGTRMHKVFCESCGYIARTSRKNIIERGAPICPCNLKSMCVDKKYKSANK